MVYALTTDKQISVPCVIAYHVACRVPGYVGCQISPKNVVKNKHGTRGPISLGGGGGLDFDYPVYWQCPHETPLSLGSEIGMSLFKAKQVLNYLIVF